MTSSEPTLTLQDAHEAWNRIRPFIARTPVYAWKGFEVGERLPQGTEVLLKLELFQFTGSFKPRGALNSMLTLSRKALSRGVVAFSAGNHAIATAYAAKALGVSAKVVMSAAANPARIHRCKVYGAEVVLAENGADALSIVKSLAENEQRALIHPFEGPAVAGGTGTLALEIHEQAGELDALVIPVGGGGLCAGVSSIMKLLQPDCRIFGVEPAGANNMAQSFRAGRPIETGKASSIADSLGPPYSLPYSFSLCRENVDRLVEVTDDELINTMGILFREMKLAVEPAGAAATAAMFGPLRKELAGKRVGVVVCGANIDIDSFANWVSRGNEMAGKI